MLGISESDLAPIRKIAVQLEPDQDRRMLGSWGILFLVCGCAAGQSLDWRATMIEQIPSTPSNVAREWLAGSSSELAIATEFSERVQEWSRDQAALGTASTRLQQLEADKASFGENARDALLAYLGLAIMLNSLSTIRGESLAAVHAWAAEESGRWEKLFFAAGLLLSAERDFPWPKIGSALLGMSGPTKPSMKALLDGYVAQTRG